MCYKNKCLAIYFHCPSGKIKTSDSGTSAEFKESRAQTLIISFSSPHHEGKSTAQSSLDSTFLALSQRCFSYFKTVSNISRIVYCPPLSHRVVCFLMSVFLFIF